jgi:hypothetical protein
MKSCWLAALVVSWQIAATALGQGCGALNWTAPGVSTPSARFGAAMAYDSARGRLVLFGGQLVGGSLSNATYEFDGAHWQEINAATPPSARYGHAMVYDSARQVVVLFGGRTGPGSSDFDNGTFTYDGVAWTFRSSGVPTARAGHGMAFDSARGRTVLFGGLLSGGTTLSHSTYEFDGQTWTQVSTSGPAARQDLAMAYDSARRVTVLFGGSTSASNTNGSDETWEWNGGGWTHVAGSGPAGRSGHCMVFDTLRGVAVMFGGLQGSGYLNSTWEYGAAGWSQRDTATSPSAKSGVCMGFDASRARVVMFGGGTASTVSDESWELTLGGTLPQFSRQPSSVQANPGDLVSFQSQASNATAWQWKRDGFPVLNGGRIAGANAALLTISGVTGADWGSYRAEATNTCGTTSSDPATLNQASRCGAADFNCDGDVGTDADIETFFACLAGTCPGGGCSSSADFNGDGDVGTDADIEAFFRVLAGGSC